MWSWIPRQIVPVAGWKKSFVSRYNAVQRAFGEGPDARERDRVNILECVILSQSGATVPGKHEEETTNENESTRMRGGSVMR